MADKVNGSYSSMEPMLGGDKRIEAGEFEKRIQFIQAYDHRGDGSERGQSSVVIRFALIGESGATQFVADTGWFLDKAVKKKLADIFPVPMGIGYHSPRPINEYGLHTTGDCDLLPGECYYDESLIAGNQVFERLIVEGHDGVWAALEEFYRETFETEKA